MRGCRRLCCCLGPVLGVVTGCDAVFGLREVARDAHVTTDVAVDVMHDAADPFRKSCHAILLANPGASSGSYSIDPDGIGGNPPITVTCDMTTDGGGWTIIFVASTANLTVAPMSYSVADPSLLAAAQDGLMVYRHADLTAYTGAASFALPADWRASTPFDYQATDLPIMASVDGAAPISTTLHYGQQNYPRYCSDPWAPASPLLGRVCIEGTTAPFYSGFVATGGDYCPDSQSIWNAATCGADLQFSLAVR